MSLVLSSLPTLTASLVALVSVLGWKLPPPICRGAQTSCNQEDLLKNTIELMIFLVSFPEQ